MTVRERRRGSQVFIPAGRKQGASPQRYAQSGKFDAGSFHLSQMLVEPSVLSQRERSKKIAGLAGNAYGESTNYVRRQTTLWRPGINRWDWYRK